MLTDDNAVLAQIAGAVQQGDVGKCSFFLIRPYSDLLERSFFIVDDRNTLLI